MITFDNIHECFLESSSSSNNDGLHFRRLPVVLKIFVIQICTWVFLRIYSQTVFQVSTKCLRFYTRQRKSVLAQTSKRNGAGILHACTLKYTGWTKNIGPTHHFGMYVFFGKNDPNKNCNGHSWMSDDDLVFDVVGHFQGHMKVSLYF